MSVIQNDEVREQLDPNTITLNKLLAENCSLIQTISEYQRMGRPNDAAKYQELLHRNLMWLSKELDPSHIPELEENLPPNNHHHPPPHSHMPQPISVGAPSSIPPPSSSSGGTSIASPSRQPHSLPPSQSQQNGHLSPYSSHGPSPHMRNGHHTPQQYMQHPQQQQHQHATPPVSQDQQQQPQQMQQMHPSQLHGGYGMPNGYPPYGMPPQGPYMNGLPPQGHMPPPPR